VSRTRWACWQCGQQMKKKGKFCRTCKRTRPQAVKASAATLTKSFGGKLRPVAVPKAATPRCPKCGWRAASTAHNCCVKCGTPYGAVQAARAEKSRSPRVPGVRTAGWWDAQAGAQWDPQAREACRAEAQKERQARGQEDAHAAAMIVKASGSRSLAEAYRRETDPRAQEILRGVLYGGGRR
jgi:hypothetical protein